MPRTAACNSRHFSGFKLGIRPSKVALCVPASVKALCQRCIFLRIFFGGKLRIFLHILVPKKCRVLQLAFRGTFPGLNWVFVPPKLPFVSLCRPMVSCQRHSSLKSFWRCTSDGLLVKDAPICAASNDMQGVVHWGGGQKLPRVASCKAQ